MNHTQYYLEQQEAKRLQNRISSFLDDFKVGTLLGGSGIRKLRGAKPGSSSFGVDLMYKGIKSTPNDEKRP